MIRAHPLLQAFEDAERRRPVTYEENLRVYEGLWAEARELGVFSSPTLDGIETDIEVARAVNALGPARADRSTSR